MFRDRDDAARQLAECLRGRDLHNPLVLAIPRGGVVTGAVLARRLGAELDVVLARKLRAPMRPELAVGAVSEDGRVYVNSDIADACRIGEHELAQEVTLQLGEIARRQRMFRQARPAAQVAGRSVIVTDDGIATGATMIAALQTARAHAPRDLIAAAPVASPDRLREVGRWCDEVVCLLVRDDLYAVGQFYENFTPVEDEEAVELLRQAAAAPV